MFVKNDTIERDLMKLLLFGSGVERDLRTLAGSGNWRKEEVSLVVLLILGGVVAVVGLSWVSSVLLDCLGVLVSLFVWEDGCNTFLLVVGLISFASAVEYDDDDVNNGEAAGLTIYSGWSLLLFTFVGVLVA
jgi:hypothetical protein